MLRWVPIATCAVLASGCYRSHLAYEGPPDASAPRDAWPAPTDAIAAPPDTGVPGAGTDAGRDSGVDAGRDSGVDAGRDGGIDAGRDSGTDTGRDGGPPPIDAGPPRPALRLSRTTFFGVEDSPIFDLPGDCTLELWVRSREASDIDFCGKGDAMARDLIAGQRGGNFVVGWSVASERYLVEGPPVPFDTWTHVAMVRRRSPSGTTHSVELYVDGALAASGTHPQLVDAFNDVPFRCGFADVDVDEIRFWRVARDGADIEANHRHRISGGIPGLQSYWRLDESGQILTDYTAMGRVGVLGLLTTPDPADPIWISDGAI